MKPAKQLLVFALIGLAASLIVAGLSTFAPSIFGALTVPLWLLPAILDRGAHDVGWPLFVVSGTICYGSASFLIWRWWRGRTEGAR